MKLAKTFLCIVIGIFITLVLSALLLLFSSSIWIFLQHYENFLINPNSVFYARTFSLLLLGSVFFSGIKSILYSLIMNLSVLPKMKKTKNIILTSSMLGGLSGLGILVFNLIFDRTFHFDLWYFYITLFGLVVGAISGYLLLKIRSFLF